MALITGYIKKGGRVRVDRGMGGGLFTWLLFFKSKKIFKTMARILNLQMVTRKDGLVPPALE